MGMLNNCDLYYKIHISDGFWLDSNLRSSTRLKSFVPLPHTTCICDFIGKSSLLVIQSCRFNSRKMKSLYFHYYLRINHFQTNITKSQSSHRLLRHNCWHTLTLVLNCHPLTQYHQIWTAVRQMMGTSNGCGL